MGLSILVQRGSVSGVQAECGQFGSFSNTTVAAHTQRWLESAGLVVIRRTFSWQCQTTPRNICFSVGAMADSIKGRHDVDHHEVAYKEKAVHDSDVLVNQDLMSNAFDGENREHEETLWHAVKTHPMACFWAFVFCFTIVSVDTIQSSTSSVLTAT